ncbi:MAG: hypothetical protein FWD45_04650 [Coriobacteriia bacterium]|nr:hypothetical protein [Coriobacteriia bacterium]
MVEEIQIHHTDTIIVNDVPTEFYVGSSIVLKIRVSCSSGCDLRSKTVEILAQDAVVAEVELSSFGETGNETDEFIVPAPTHLGEHRWIVVFPAQEQEGVIHQESSALFSFITKPHATSMAVWDVPSPIALGTYFKCKVGVKCLSECDLAGKTVVLRNDKGHEAVESLLGTTPWTPEGALYWTEVELKAPDVEGSYVWEAAFCASDMEIPHEDASYSFRFRTVAMPDHMLTVEVVAQDSKKPIKGADVTLPPFIGRTDEHGIARFEVHKGDYELSVSKYEYEIFETTLKVDDDISFKAELLTLYDTFWLR